jgi:hypothetical protein
MSEVDPLVYAEFWREAVLGFPGDHVLGEWYPFPAGGRWRYLVVVHDEVTIEYDPLPPVNFTSLGVVLGDVMSEKPVCSTCDGTGQLKCVACGGEGKYDCDECSGTGECSSCGYSGDPDLVGSCDDCNGGGTCSNCGGDGDFDCEECDLSTGRVACHECKAAKPAEEEKADDDQSTDGAGAQ